MRKIAYASLGCLTSLLAACGQSGTQNACPTTSATSATIYSQPPQEKLDVNFASTTSVAAGSNLTAIVYDGCVNPGPVTSAITDLEKGQTKAGVRSYSWIAPRDFSYKELSQMANDDSCLHMLTENVIEQTPDIDPSEADMEAAIQTLPNDPKTSLQAHLSAINASSAYDIFYKAGTGITKPMVIAIIDSGVDLNHEDLQPNLWRNPREIPNNGIDDDRNGYVDDVYGYNFASRIPSPMYQKSTANGAWQYAHGTRVAGLAAAVSNNGKGGTGVMGTAKIMALNVMGTASSMSQSSIANAIRYAADNGANVINLSLGGFNAASTDYKNALKYATQKGVVIFAAAGNESSLISSTYSAAGQASSIPGLMSVANLIPSTLAKSSSSNYSSTYVEIGAPGSNLYSTAPGNTYGYFSGTSAATPVAAGAGALAMGLIKSRGYAQTAYGIEQLLTESSRTVSSLTSYVKGGRALDLAALARLIDKRYPARTTLPPASDNTSDAAVPPVAGGGNSSETGSGLPGTTGQCAAG